MNLSINKITYSFISSPNLIIRRFIIENLIIHYFKAVSRKLIHRFSRIKLTFLTIIRFLTRFINRYTSRKYIFLLICSIADSLLIDLSLYIKSKNFKSLTFHLFPLFSSIIVINSKDFNSLNKFYYSIYNEYSITY